MKVLLFSTLLFIILVIQVRATGKLLKKLKQGLPGLKHAKNSLKHEKTDENFPHILTYLSKEQPKSVKTVKAADLQIKLMVEEAKLNKINGIWFQIHVNDSFWVAACHNNKFELQLAVGESLHMKEKDVIYMKLWLGKKEENSMPLPAFTTIGLAAVVINEHNEYAARVSDPVNDKGRTGTTKDGFKFPGKALLPGETFETAIKRILEVEVGMDKEHLNFHGVLEIKLMPEGGQAVRGKGDMFIYCIVTTKKNMHSKFSGKWLPRGEITDKNLQNRANYSAVIASDGWMQKYKEEFQKDNTQPKLFKPAQKTAVTYVFYPQEEQHKTNSHESPQAAEAGEAVGQAVEEQAAPAEE